MFWQEHELTVMAADTGSNPMINGRRRFLKSALGRYALMFYLCLVLLECWNACNRNCCWENFLKD